MADVHFTARLHTLVPKNGMKADGATVREILENVFAEFPQARSYVLDEQKALRKHVCIFLDGNRLPHVTALETQTTPASEVYVMQALSGG